MTKDLHNAIVPKRAISPVSVSDNTAQVSQIIDRQGFEALEFLILIGSVADADTTITALLEESDSSDLSGSNAVADADMLGTEAGASFQFDDDNEWRKLGYKGTKRYVRLTLTPANNASAMLIGAVAVLGSPRTLPQTSQG